jgi:hypothetical protein
VCEVSLRILIKPSSRPDVSQPVTYLTNVRLENVNTPKRRRGKMHIGSLEIRLH